MSRITLRAVPLALGFSLIALFTNASVADMESHASGLAAASARPDECVVASVASIGRTRQPLQSRHHFGTIRRAHASFATAMFTSVGPQNAALFHDPEMSYGSHIRLN
jgi:hypothetical protein